MPHILVKHVPSFRSTISRHDPAHKFKEINIKCNGYSTKQLKTIFSYLKGDCSWTQLEIVLGKTRVENLGLQNNGAENVYLEGMIV